MFRNNINAAGRDGPVRHRYPHGAVLIWTVAKKARRGLLCRRERRAGVAKPTEGYRSEGAKASPERLWSLERRCKSWLGPQKRATSPVRHWGCRIGRRYPAFACEHLFLWWVTNPTTIERLYEHSRRDDRCWQVSFAWVITQSLNDHIDELPTSFGDSPLHS